MKGSKFLKVTGILMIIFGAIALIMSILAIAGIGVLAAVGISAAGLWLSGIFALLGAVAEFIAGIIGVKNCDKPEGAKSCVIWGSIVVAFCILSNVITLVVYSENFSIFSVFTGLVIPVLYLVGAFQNKKEAETTAVEQ